MKKRLIASLSLLERDCRPCRGGSELLLDLSTLWYHERQAFSGSLEVHRQPLQKIMSHSKMSR